MHAVTHAHHTLKQPKIKKKKKNRSQNLNSAPCRPVNSVKKYVRKSRNSCTTDQAVQISRKGEADGGGPNCPPTCIREKPWDRGCVAHGREIGKTEKSLVTNIWDTSLPRRLLGYCHEVSVSSNSCWRLETWPWI